MSRLTYVLGVPALMIATAALYFAYVVSLGFASEGCRFPRQGSELWSIVGDWALLHALFLVGFLLPVVGIISLLGQVRVRGRRVGPMIGGLASAAFVVSATASLVYLLGCQGDYAGVLLPASRVLRGLASIATIAFIVSAILGYVAGLGQQHESSP